MHAWPHLDSSNTAAAKVEAPLVVRHIPPICYSQVLLHNPVPAGTQGSSGFRYTGGFRFQISGTQGVSGFRFQVHREFQVSGFRYTGCFGFQVSGTQGTSGFRFENAGMHPSVAISHPPHSGHQSCTPPQTAKLIPILKPYPPPYPPSLPDFLT